MAEELNEQTIKVIPKPNPELSADLSGSFMTEVAEAAQIGTLDISSIDALSQSAQNREQMYQLLEQMAKDDVVSAVLETYVQDIIQTNDDGQIVTVDSNDTKVLEYVTWLKDTLNIDKHMRQWADCLITYGDVYVRFYRKSDTGEDLLFTKAQKNRNRQLHEALETVKKPKSVQEAINLNLYSVNDPYVNYVEMVPNPGEMFDLQKFGKTYAYIKSPIRQIQQSTDELYSYMTRYNLKQSDVEIYDATTFAHAYLEATTQRNPEIVDIFLDGHNEEGEYNEYGEKIDRTYDQASTTSFQVKRGQSILYNSFRIWRELNLLEMSALLNRITKSSVIRVITIETGDMPKEQVRNYLEKLKEKIEQKASINTDKGASEYNDPAPIINTIYTTTHGGQGGLTATTIGGDFDPKSLVDIEYFRDKLFGSLKVPKQFFGFTEDGAGFNGSTSLTILSARYGNAVKMIQKILAQLVQDIFNLFLIDRGLENYVNRFTVRLQPPVTQEEIDRRTNTDNRTRYVGDIMNQLNTLIPDNNALKLKFYKVLANDIVADKDFTALLQGEIDRLEKQAEAGKDDNNNPEGGDNPDMGGDLGGGGGLDFGQDVSTATDELPSAAEVDAAGAGDAAPAEESFTHDENKQLILEDEGTNDSYMPSPNELGVDCTDKR